MTLGIFGKKIGMSQMFDGQGYLEAVTLVKVLPCQVSQIKTLKVDGYSAVQLAYNKNKRMTQPILGHLKNLGSHKFTGFGEFLVDNPDLYCFGESITIQNFVLGQKLKVGGVTAGKGFSGSIKRHHFHRGPMSHGSKNHRLVGSIGAGTTPGRVFPGKKMAGQLGNTKATANSEVLFIDENENTLFLKGAIPGTKGTILKLFSA